jgi:hypothetical protein
MTTIAVFDGALAGALAGILDGRQYNGQNPTSPPTAALAASAQAFALQFLVANAALATPMADATTNIALVCYAAAYGELSGRNYVSAVSTDYANQAAAAAAVAKAASVLLT